MAQGKDISWMVCTSPAGTPVLIRADAVIGCSDARIKGLGEVTMVSVTGGQFAVRETVYQVAGALDILRPGGPKRFPRALEPLEVASLQKEPIRVDS